MSTEIQKTSSLPQNNFNTRITHDSSTENHFCQYLWKKISETSKQILCNNNFVYPPNLNNSYHYIKLDGSTFIIDTSSNLRHRGQSDIFLGQNLKTHEFLAFKSINPDISKDVNKHQEVVGQTNLHRFKGIFIDNGKTYMAMELIDGIRLLDYEWQRDSGDLFQAVKLGISYIDELIFIYNSKVTHPNCKPSHVMVDLKHTKVFLIDFSGYAANWFNLNTATFVREQNFELLSRADLYNVLMFLPHPSRLDVNHENFKEYEKLYNSVQNIKNGPVKNYNCFTNVSILDLKDLLTKFLDMRYSSLSQIASTLTTTVAATKAESQTISDSSNDLTTSIPTPLTLINEAGLDAIGSSTSNTTNSATASTISQNIPSLAREVSSKSFDPQTLSYIAPTDSSVVSANRDSSTLNQAAYIQQLIKQYCSLV